ncbi:hypothetical protein CONPUDRAFT_160625 [Coniophora puteana RWD-64-598 SS2]|uniref:Uncharacterized protein n=1 Tax=Coniophora puteana (strain RWD-64-598) TaxID=741705 RepID=R7SCG3_CONPW|nr:uncharacterized protein CONPUDRAFT_160625 [Coniophora puteana RWD-64-598 SS2]EIW73861.1 hypothetical protein CONPUDRAFT_160625 [Coniophora puteana RWD-64-598 SS2]
MGEHEQTRTNTGEHEQRRQAQQRRCARVFLVYVGPGPAYYEDTPTRPGGVPYTTQALAIGLSSRVAERARRARRARRLGRAPRPPTTRHTRRPKKRSWQNPALASTTCRLEGRIDDSPTTNPRPPTTRHTRRPKQRSWQNTALASTACRLEGRIDDSPTIDVDGLLARRLGPQPPLARPRRRQHGPRAPGPSTRSRRRPTLASSSPHQMDHAGSWSRQQHPARASPFRLVGPGSTIWPASSRSSTRSWRRPALASP